MEDTSRHRRSKAQYSNSSRRTVVSWPQQLHIHSFWYACSKQTRQYSQNRVSVDRAPRLHDRRRTMRCPDCWSALDAPLVGPSRSRARTARIRLSSSSTVDVGSSLQAMVTHEGTDHLRAAATRLSAVLASVVASVGDGLWVNACSLQARVRVSLGQRCVRASMSDVARPIRSLLLIPCSVVRTAQ